MQYNNEKLFSTDPGLAGGSCNGIASVFVFGFLGGWNELIGATIFVSTAENWTIPVALKALIGKNNIEWGVLMAGGVIALLPTGILFAVMQKFVVEGITAGAVKE